MAEIRPLRAWRYNQERFKNIDALTSPLFDVVSERQRQELYRNPYNSIHLSVPQGELPAQAAGRLIETWKSEGVLLQDKLPAIYVYYQHFSMPGSPREMIRKGFVCNIRAYDWNEKVLLRHENTMPHSVNDRLELLHETQLNVSPTHGLYTDTHAELEALMDESMEQALYETEDYQGVRDRLGVIHDARAIRKFQQVLADKQVILADGHHRYEGSLLYRKQCQQQNPNHSGEEGYNFHLMYLTNTESDDLRILPTHRLIRGLPHFSEHELLQKLEPYFHIRELENPEDANTIILGKQWAFGLILKDRAYKIRLKPERWQELAWKMPDQIKQLDLTVLHYFVIDQVLGIPGKEQRRSPHLLFERNFASCLTQVMKGEAQCALIIKDISMEEVKKVCYSGFTMPQKSTYFYPKVICGLLFSSIKDDEFSLPPYFSF